MDRVDSLREKARRYRKYAEKLGGDFARAMIEAAEDLERQAERLEAAQRARRAKGQ